MKRSCAWRPDSDVLDFSSNNGSEFPAVARHEIAGSYLAGPAPTSGPT